MRVNVTVKLMLGGQRCCQAQVISAAAFWNGVVGDLFAFEFFCFERGAEIT